MVGGLVQKEDIRFHQQETAKSHPCFLTAGQGTDFFGKFFLFKSQAFEYAVDFTFVCVSVLQFETGREAVVTVHQPGEILAGYQVHLLFHLTQTVFHIDHRLFDFQQGVVDGGRSVHILVLCQIAQRFVAGCYSQTTVTGHFTGNNFQQRGFPGSVGADQGGFFPFFYMK